MCMLEIGRSSLVLVWDWRLKRDRHAPSSLHLMMKFLGTDVREQKGEGRWQRMLVGTPVVLLLLLMLLLQRNARVLRLLLLLLGAGAHLAEEKRER